MWAPLVLVLSLWPSLAEVADSDTPWSPSQLHGSGSRYTLDAALTVAEGGKAGGGVRLRGMLAVTPLHSQSLMLLELADTVVEQQWGTDQWKKVGKIVGEWAVGWEGGNITAWLDPGERWALRNVQRGLGGLLVTDAVNKGLGGCEVDSAVEGDTRRDVRRCGDGVARVVRYTRGEGGRLQTLAAEEVISSASPVVRARSWVRLTRLPHSGSTAPDALPTHLTPHDVLAEAIPDDDKKIVNVEQELETIIASLVSSELAGEGGSEDLARGVTGLRGAVQAKGGKRLTHMVSSSSPRSLGPLLFALGLSGCTAAMAAADSTLQLATDAAADQAHHYFRGLSLAHAPQDEVILWALETGESSRDERVRAAAILGAAGAAGRGEGAIRDALLQRLLKGLAKCAKEEAASNCRTVYLRALGALHHSGAISALLEHATRADPRAAIAALSSLASLQQPIRSAVSPLLRLSLDTPALARPRPLEVRAAALTLGTRLSASHSPSALATVARALASLQDPLASELRRIYWQLLGQLTAIPAVKELLGELPADIIAQHMYALNGTSASVHRTAWVEGGWTAAMTADTASAAGLLRQQVVRVTAEGRHSSPAEGGSSSRELLTVAVSAWGLHGLAGQAAPHGATEDEEAEAAIDMTVLGAPLPSLTLFSGQAALLGALWAGAGSEPTPVLRTSAVLRDEQLTVNMLLGSVTLDQKAGISLALDGSGVASLWSRTARASLELRAAIAVNTTAIAFTPWGAITASSAVSAAPKLSISADLDFYSDPVLCVKANTPDYRVHSNSTLMTSRGSRRRYAVTSRPARSLALTKDIHSACRATHATSDE